MAVGTPVHRLVNNGTGAIITTTGSYAFPVGSLVLASVARRSASALPAAPAVTGGDQTWTALIPDGTYDVGSGVRLRLSLWGTLITAAVPAFPVTTTQSSGPTTSLIVTEVPGAAGTITNYDYDDDSAGDPVAVMATPSAASISMAFLAVDAVTGIGPPSSFTELRENNTAAGLTHQTNFIATPVDTATWSTAGAEALGLIVEIRTAGRTRAAAAWF